MGSEDLFHKRKARKVEDSARSKAKRKPYDRILIVCEGEKTEPYYFEEVRIGLDLDSANVAIDGSCGSSPKSIVNHALSEFCKERQKFGHYDKVFCVFDRDSHGSFDWAINRVDELNAQLMADGYSDEQVFHSIRSNPAFEYWLLLHFIPSTKPYKKKGNKSVGDQVISELKKYMPNYTKTQLGIYDYTLKENLLAGAKANSKRIFTQAELTKDFNPSTNVHELMEYLENVKN